MKETDYCRNSSRRCPQRKGKELGFVLGIEKLIDTEMLKRIKTTTMERVSEVFIYFCSVRIRKWLFPKPYVLQG